MRKTYKGNNFLGKQRYDHSYHVVKGVPWGSLPPVLLSKLC